MGAKLTFYGRWESTGAIGYAPVISEIKFDNSISIRFPGMATVEMDRNTWKEFARAVEAFDEKLRLEEAVKHLPEMNP